MAETSTSDYLILFGDLVGSTEVAVEATPLFFARTYIASFHWAAHKALDCVKKVGDIFGDANFTKRIENIDIAGDEVHAFIPIDSSLGKTGRDNEDLVASAVSFAYVTKLYWLAAPYNLNRMLDQQFPRDISVGIHIGRAAAVQDSEGSDVAGLHINITKRIESQAREAKESRIFASRDVTDLFEEWRKRNGALPEASRPPLWFTKFFHRPEPISGKGVPKKLNVLELERAEKTVDQELIKLITQLATTPETEEVSAESVARIMAETFIPNSEAIFADPELSVDNVVSGAQTAEAYINKWFDALQSFPKIFLDEPWLIFNCFFVSSMLMRHPAIRAEERDRSKKIVLNLLLRLDELLKRGSQPE